MKRWRGLIAGTVIGVVVTFGLMSDFVASLGKSEAIAVVMFHSHSVELHPTGYEGVVYAKRDLYLYADMVVSEEVLQKVVRDTGYSLKELRSCLKIAPRDDTFLIEIEASHEDSLVAKEIANAVAEVFVAHLNESQAQRVVEALERLDNELEEMGDVVQDSRKELTILVQKYGIPGLERTTEEDLYKQAQEKLDRLWQDKQFLRVAFQTLKQTELSTRKNVSEGIVDFGNQSQKYFDRIRELNGQINVLSEKGLGEDHPKIQQSRKAVARIFEVAKKEAMAFVETLDERSQELEEEISEMKMIRRGGGSPPVDKAMRQHQYEIVKREYEHVRDVYIEMEKKQQDSRRRLKLRQPLVSVHQRAE